MWSSSKSSVTPLILTGGKSILNVNCERSNSKPVSGVIVGRFGRFTSYKNLNESGWKQVAAKLYCE